MKTLIVYASKHGCTAGAVRTLEERLLGEVSLVDIGNEKPQGVDLYDTVIVGGSIHAGSIQKKVRRFCDDNIDVLLEKRLGLFLCCMYEGDEEEKQFENSFDPRLRDHAAARGLFGGRFDFEKMNFFERAIVKKVAGVTESVSSLRPDAIEAFAEEIVG